MDPYSAADAMRRLPGVVIDDQALLLGIDIGGTKTAAGVVAPDGRTLSFHVEPTPRDADAESLFAFVVSLAERARDGFRDRVMAAGVGCGGPMIYPDGIVSPLFIPAWRSFPLRARLASALSLPITLDNDANAFALGEAMFGVGRGARYMLGMIVSTGVGGGIVVDGRVFHGATGNAGHIGHTIVSAEGPRCSCGAVGCLTAYASGTGLVARAQSGIQAGMPTTLATLSEGALTGQAIAEAAASGDAFATELIHDAGVAIAWGIVDAASLLDLDRVVLGGGLIQAGEILLDSLRNELRERARLPFTRDLDIRMTAAAREAGVIGAAALCLQEQPGT
ncbi:MAG TPA: ROK family protein [Ktedonobacterales bacterium]|nr:ROK family protein [Ktedonobacterales bacterium]